MHAMKPQICLYKVKRIGLVRTFQLFIHREKARKRKEENIKALAILMNCGVVLGFYCWGWEFLTALLLFSHQPY